MEKKEVHLIYCRAGYAIVFPNEPKSSCTECIPFDELEYFRGYFEGKGYTVTVKE